MSDRNVIYVAAFLRSLATGMAGVLIGIYLAKRGFDPGETGAVVGAGLAGAALAALVVTLAGDRIGRRKTLVVLSLLGALGGLAVALSSGIAVIGAAAFVGMLNGMGRDRGGCLIIDQAILPATSSDAQRTTAFAWYTVLQDAGHALGGLLAGAPALLQAVLHVEEGAAFKVALAAYAALLLATAVVYARLSRAVEGPQREGPPLRVSPQSRGILWKISSLFAVDSLWARGPWRRRSPAY